MKYLLLVSLLTFGCSQNSQDGPYIISPSFSVDYSIVGDSYKSLASEINETTISVRLVGNLTKQQYENSVKKIINELVASKSFNKITLRLIDSRVEANIGEIGVLIYEAANKSNFVINFTPDFLSQWGQSITKLYDVEVRQNIYQEVLAAHKKASDEAIALSKNYVPKEQELLLKYVGELKVKYKLNEGQVIELEGEGFDKSW